MQVDPRKLAEEQAKQPDAGTQVTTADHQYVDALLSQAWEGSTNGVFGRDKTQAALLELEAWLKQVPTPASEQQTASKGGDS